MEKIDNLKRKKILQAINFLEELSWLLDTKKNLDLKDVPDLLRKIIDSGVSHQLPSRFSSPNPNKNFLIGVLPSLFQDEELFKTTNEMIDFAQGVLKIPISKAAKRSRYEYIGLIVCEVINLDDGKLSELVNAFSELTNNNEKLKQIKEAKKKANFSWNEAIRNLTAL